MALFFLSIIFMKQDMMEPQRLMADVYVLRFVLHDWSDKYAAQILRNLLPALRPGARIAIMENILPEPNVMPKMVEKIQRYASFSPFPLFHINRSHKANNI